MDFQQVIQHRRTIRDFSSRPVDGRDIRDALEDAFRAPTYNHLKEWYFLLVDDPAVKMQLTGSEEMPEEVSEKTKASFKDHDPAAREMYLQAIPKQRKMILEAPLCIAAVYKPKTPVREAQRVYDLNGFASIWCAIENLLLSLCEKEIFGVTFIPKNTPFVREILGIPAEYEVAALIPVGYKKRGVRDIPPKGIVLDERIRRNSWRPDP